MMELNVKNDPSVEGVFAVECVKCHKKVAPENVHKTKHGYVCNNCSKVKRNRLYTAICYILGCCIAASLIWWAISSNKKIQTATGFEGVNGINDSINLVIDSVANVEFNIATATLLSAPVNAQAPVNNINDFKRVLSQNIEKAKSGNTNSLDVPVSAIMFSFCSAQISKEGEQLLQEIISLYNKTNKVGSIVIEGYACNIGEDAPNDYISKQRAEAVKSYFVEADVDPSKIVTRWYGKSKNAEFNLPNNSDNRRVLISIK